MKKAFQGIHKGRWGLVIRVICGTRCKIIGFSCASNVLSLSILPCQKSNLAFIRPRNRTSIQAFCTMARLVQASLPPHPASVACFPGCASTGAHLWGPCGCQDHMAAKERKHGNKWASARYIVREKDFVSQDYIISGLGWTMQFSKQPINFPRFHRLVLGPPSKQSIP